MTTDGDYMLIEGGVQSGINLFHRFDGFGIGVGETADFVVPEATQAVFGQMTGAASTSAQLLFNEAFSVNGLIDA